MRIQIKDATSCEENWHNSARKMANDEKYPLHIDHLQEGNKSQTLETHYKDLDFPDLVEPLALACFLSAIWEQSSPAQIKEGELSSIFRLTDCLFPTRLSN